MQISFFPRNKLKLLKLSMKFKTLLMKIHGGFKNIILNIALIVSLIIHYIFRHTKTICEQKYRLHSIVSDFAEEVLQF